MTWHSVASPSDADELLQRVGRFHDGCLRDLYLWTGYFIVENVSMCVPQKDVKCRVLVQLGRPDMPAVELLFDNVSRLTLLDDPRYDRIIFGATLSIAPGKVMWSPEDVDVASMDSSGRSVIVAERMWWRRVENGLGEVLRLVPFGELPPGLDGPRTR